MKNNLKNLVRSNFNKVYWITNPNLINIEIILEKKYFDIFVIDNEHSLISVEEIRNLIILFNSLSKPIFMRFGRFNISDAPKYLDFGIDGVIASDISNMEDLDYLKRVIYYKNIGDRGVGLGRMNKHGNNFKNYMKLYHKKLVLLPMIEQKITKNIIELIFKDEMVDGCLIGPYDLSMSIGKPGNFYSKDFKEIELHIIKMKNKYKKAAGFHFMEQNISKIKLIKKKGFNFVPILTDVQFFKIGTDKVIA